MTASIRYFFVDVFADRPLTGNPLTLVPDADDLTAAQMQAIARELNQSETTFLLRPDEVDEEDEEDVAWRLRSFTPAGVEVYGAGHNALGAWLWLAEEGLTGAAPSITLRQRIGEEVLDVEIVRPADGPVRVVMDQGAPTFGAVVAPRDGLAAALGLDADRFAEGAPAQTVSTGVAHLLVALVDREAVDAVVVETRPLAALLAGAGAEGCYVYTTDAGAGSAAYARFFNPTVGIAEDPATGTAAGPLAAALVHRGQAPPASPVWIQQGHRLGRPSRIRVDVDVDGDRVRLSGSGVVAGHGELRLA